MCETWRTFQSPPVVQFMDVRKTQSSTQKLSNSIQLIITEDITQARVATKQVRPSDLCLVIKPMTALFQSQTLRYMVTSGLTNSVTGSSTPSSLTTAPRPQVRGEERDPRLRGRHQPGEDGRPQGPGERERGDATILPRQLGRCRVHIVACITFCLLCFYVISQIHTFNPKTCRSITPIIRGTSYPGSTRAARVSEEHSTVSR